MNEQFEELVLRYFHMGKSYGDIVEILNNQHQLLTSIRTIKRFLQEVGLKRNEVYSQSFVNLVVREVLQGPGSSLGYRLLRQRIVVEYGIKIPKEQIRQAVLIIDPAGVNLRQQRRLHRRTYHAEMPNKSHHLDGYDKLKPYGFSIYATIDGHSRYVLHLNVMVSNKEPHQVGHCFLDGAIENGGLPSRTVSDFGTETGIVVGIMRRFVGQQSHTYTSSQRNQRIESWWSQLRRGATSYIMNHFALLESEELVNFGNEYDKDLIRYSFMTSIQHELNIYRASWNLHPIRSQRYNHVPCGVPTDLHFNSGADGKIAIPYDILQNIRNGLQPRNSFRTGDLNKDKALFVVCCNQGLNMNPKTLIESTDLFLKLKNLGRIY